MDFLNSDPGAAQYGNFINYYEFNNAKHRLQLLPRDVWLGTHLVKSIDEPYLVLDVGCNAGNLTQLLYRFLEDCLGPNKRIHILGVDIDANLINRAADANEYPTNVSYAALDIMNENAFGQVNEFLRKYACCKFDAICCFSITMWIHLNHGDDGLQKFLQKLGDLGELLVVEPQPWKCYQTAKRRMKKAGVEFLLFKELQWRYDVEANIQAWLESNIEKKKIHECIPTRWQRRICFYR